MIFDIGDDVPDDQLELIKSALALAQDYVSRLLGGDIPDGIADISTIKIVATGLGDDGSGATATAGFSDGKFGLFFDVAHVQWNQDSTGRGWTTESDNMKTVAHEYGHAWQMWLGAFDKPLGGALNEGIAEYVAYSVMVDAGRMAWTDVRPFMLNGAHQSHELDAAVREVENVVWSGHVGFLAIDWLISKSSLGPVSLRTLATGIGDGASIPDAFRAAFNIELEDFYTQFEAWRQIIVADPQDGYANRPTLINIGESADGATAGPDVIAGTPTKDDLAGLAGDDHISGRGGNDKLYGNEDNDTLVGGAGKDKLDGGHGRDTASYADATAAVTVSLETPAGNTGDARGDTYILVENLAGSEFSDVLAGDNSRNLITGGKGDDAIDGDRGRDTLAGGEGNDKLDGGDGKDVFVFDTELGSSNVDEIAHFKPADDTIWLEKDVFIKAGKPGGLDDDAFIANKSGKAEDKQDRVIYEKDTGKLFFDADGTRSGKAVLFATLDKSLHLTHEDFVIV